MSKKIVKETFSQSVFALMVSQVVVKSLGLFYRLYLTNRNGFGDEGNALAGAGYQIFALILSITAIGIPNAISRLVAQRSTIGDHRGANRIFKVALIIFSIIGMTGSYLLFYYAKPLANSYLHIKESELSIIALSPSVFLVAVISVFKGYFNGRESIKITAKAQACDQISKTIATIVMVELSVVLLKYENTMLMASLSSLATTIGNIFEFAVLYKFYIKNLPEIRMEIENSVNTQKIGIKSIAKEILLIAIPISLTALIGTISKNIDSTTIVNKLTGIIGYEEAKKEYGVLSGKVDSLINFPLSFNMAIATALLPSIAASSNNIREKEGRINHTFLMEMCIAIPVTIIFFIYADDILKLLFPNASNGGMIFKISSLSIIFITVEQITNNILHAIGKTLIPIKAITLGVITKAILNHILIPNTQFILGGTKGAAFATVVCHAISAIIALVMLIKQTKLKLSIGIIVKPLTASLFLILASKLTYIFLQNKINLQLNLLLSLAIGIIIYLLMLMHLKVFNKGWIKNAIGLEK